MLRELPEESGVRCGCEQMQRRCSRIKHGEMPAFRGQEEEENSGRETETEWPMR